MGCTYALDLAASIHDDEANYTQYALLSAVAAATAAPADDATHEALESTQEHGGSTSDAQGEGVEGAAAQGGGASQVAEGEVPADAVATGAANAASAFGSLVELVRFLRVHVFCESSDILGTFMEVFWPQCAQHAAQAAGAITDQADALQRTIEVGLFRYVLR